MIETIQAEILECGEGPMWDPKTQRLYWTNALGQGLYVYDRIANQVAVLTKNVQAGSIVVHSDGGLLLGGGKGFYRWQANDHVRTVADTCDGRPVNLINDIIADPRGRIFGGQEVHQDDKPYEPGYLFRVDLDGSTQIVEEGLHVSNGMGFSLDNQTFYLIDSIPGNVYAYDYSMETGAIKNRRVLVNLSRDDGIPDGMTVDREGYIWLARWFGGAISRYDPDGKLERSIELPVAQPSSVMFGGKDLNELYVTTAGVKWETPIAPAGHDFSTERGGQLFRITQDIQGRVENLARV